MVWEWSVCLFGRSLWSRGASVHGSESGGRTWVELSEDVLWDTLKHFLGENSQQSPSDFEWLEDGTVLVVTFKKRSQKIACHWSVRPLSYLRILQLTLRDECLLELIQKLQIEQVIGWQSLLTDDSLHGLHVLTNCIVSILKDVFWLDSCADWIADLENDPKLDLHTGSRRRRDLCESCPHQ